MKICFVMPRAHELISGQAAIHGGAELQMVRLARQFTRLASEVTFVTADPGGSSESVVLGVQILPAFRERRGLPGIGFLSMWYGIRRGLDKSGADVFIQRSASPLTGLMARYARRRGRLFVYMISNDTNVNGFYESKAGFRDSWLYRRGIREAHGIVAQTETQARLLKDRYDREAYVLPNAVEALPDPPPLSRPETVFWAASFQRHKRPHKVLELARRAPDLNFVMAGPLVNDPDLMASFERDVRDVSNVTFLGHLSKEAMEAEYLKAIAFLSTSEYEGFPNTFLEAWRLGVPVVSMNADPDETICRFGLGLHTDDVDRILDGIRLLRDDPKEQARIRTAARSYMGRHEERVVAKDFAEWLEKLSSSSETDPDVS